MCIAFSDSNRSVGMLNPSYSLYPTLTSLQRSNLSLIEFYDDQFDLPIDRIVNNDANLFFLTNPHAPSGVFIRSKGNCRSCFRINSILVVDEAYADFATDSCRSSAFMRRI